MNYSSDKRILFYKLLMHPKNRTRDMEISLKLTKAAVDFHFRGKMTYVPILNPG